MLSSPLLITAGPTYEDIDSVRFLGNRSSGRMGFSLARAAAERGWEATLALGPVTLPPDLPSSVRLLRFRSTADLQALLRKEWPEHHSLIMAAAVADYRPARRMDGKMRREGSDLVLELEPTPDLLQECGRNKKPDQFLVGFALEPADRLLTSAQEKLVRKNLDAIVANPLETMDAGDVSATILRPGMDPVRVELQKKESFAGWLLDMLAGVTPSPATSTGEKAARI